MISFIVAMDKNRVIGKENQLPWHLPADLQFFKRVTSGHVIVMGRKTYESIGKPLPNRTNVIITRQADFQAEGCLVFHDVDSLMAHFSKEEELFVIGGAEIFSLFMPNVDRMYITLINHEFEGDTYFPEIDGSEWEIIHQEKGVRDEKNPYDYSFITWQRRES